MPNATPSHKKLLIASAVVAPLMTAMLCLGLAKRGAHLAYVVFAGATCAVVVPLVLRLMYDRVARGHIWARAFPSMRKKHVLAAAGIILLFWSPWLLLDYPASMTFDTYNQLTQFFSPAPTYYTTLGEYLPGEFIDHHPVFDTLVFGSFYWVGMALGHQNLGLFLYALCQSAALALMLALCVCYLCRLHVPVWWRRALLLVCCVCASYPQFATSMVKDSLFCVPFLGFLLGYVQIWRTEGDALHSRKFLALFVSSMAVACLAKKPGLIVVAGSMLTLMVGMRRHIARLLASTAAALAIPLLVVPMVVYPLIGGVAAGGRQETVGPLLQQAITAVLECDDITQGELHDLRRVVRLEEALKRYDATLVDGVKNRYNKNARTSDLVAFLKTWASIGARHPLVYLRATLRASGPLMLPGWKPVTYRRTPVIPAEMRRNLRQHVDVDLAYYKPLWSERASVRVYRMLDRLRCLPVLDVAMSRGFFAWLSIGMLVAALVAHRQDAVAWAPLAWSLLILLISPVAFYRYALPIAYAFTLHVGLFANALWNATYAQRTEHVLHSL